MPKVVELLIFLKYQIFLLFGFLFYPYIRNLGNGFFYFFFGFASNFCIIEGPETVQDFMQMQLQEIEDNIRRRRNKIFLLMEEVSKIP